LAATGVATAGDVFTVVPFETKRRDRPGLDSLLTTGPSFIGRFRRRRSTPEQAVHHWHEEKGENGSNHQATDDGSAKRSVLLAPLAQAQRHGQHADDHG